METCFNYCEPHNGFFSSDERKWIAKISKLKEKYPNEIKIIAEPEINNGCIYCRLPAEWFRIQPPGKGRVMTEEEKQAGRERLEEYRRKKNAGLV